MSIKATCTCGAEFNVKPELAGKRVKCPKCGDTFAVPKPQTAESRIRVTCQCGKAVKAKRELAGKRVKCPACGQALDIPTPTVKAAQRPSGDISSGTGNTAADPGGPTSPQAVPTADHGQGESEKSHRRRYILIGIGGAGALIALLLIAAGLGLFRNGTQAPGEASSTADTEKAEMATGEAGPIVAVDSIEMKLAVEKAVARQEACSEKLGLPVDIANSIGMKLKLIPAGEFMMGSPASDEDASDDEKPQHKVQITKPFHIGVYEVTLAEYETLMGKDSSRSLRRYGAGHISERDTSRYPVDQVLEGNAMEFCMRLSDKEGKTYRLPTEVEWEYACRAGTTTRYSFGNDPANLGQYAWYKDNSGRNTHPIGEKRPNAWGLYDMHGNVSEWCQLAGRRERGGCWQYDARLCRSASRPPTSSRRGFRVVLGAMSEEAKAAMEEAVAERSSPRTEEQVAARKAAKEASEEAGAAQETCSESSGKSVEMTNSIGMRLRLIPAGEFMMGSAKSPMEIGSMMQLTLEYLAVFARSHLQHRVRITKPFYLGVHEVTVGQFRQFVEATGHETDMRKTAKGGWGWSESDGKTEGPNPKYTWRDTGWLQTDAHPVVNTSWNDAMAFCDWLSRKEGKEYRLPTEAEWEYACRAGTTTLYYHGDDPQGVTQVGNVRDASAERRLHKSWSPHTPDDGHLFTAPVGGFRPNGFGLYDMLGNACEWCADWYADNYYEASPADDPTGPIAGARHVFRGAFWGEPPDYCWSAFRPMLPPGARHESLGFRIVLGENPGPDALKRPGAATKESAVAQRAAIEQAAARQEECSQKLGLSVEITNSIGMKLKLIPTGEFMMGSLDSDNWAASFERAQHKVRITKPFYLGVHEVTQAEYAKVMGKKPSGSRTAGADSPMTRVSWDDAVEFCKRLTAKESMTYRLPTEAEWEYACRAGSTTRYSFGDDPTSLHKFAWYLGNYDRKQRKEPAVGEKRPNAWGLYDMHGNSWEWCADWWSADYYARSPTDDPTGPTAGAYHVFRGGCRFSDMRRCRSADRSGNPPDAYNREHGFRVAAGAPGE